MSANGNGQGWALRIHAACEWILWAMIMNALWIFFTLLGGVLLGAAPATVAAALLTRRRLRGELFSAWREFPRAWRAEFTRAHLVVSLPLAIAVALVVRAASFIREGDVGPAALATIAAAVFAVTLTTVLVPLYAHYDLPARSYVVTASRWLLRNSAHGLLLVAAAVAVSSASAAFPGLLPFVSVGAWLTLSTALCIGFFTANDRALAEAADAAPTPVGATPSA